MQTFTSLMLHYLPTACLAIVIWNNSKLSFTKTHVFSVCGRLTLLQEIHRTGLTCLFQFSVKTLFLRLVVNYYDYCYYYYKEL